ncbi:hypothetical protein HanRHA438_Chr00c20g0852001 [Helianthus annuus]|uniref:Uncharacterized protein n=1 Tax=Helianthus annuus TaxID=4232 RepID=A0A9K3JLP9_HELAN|nr:hypothetical protein HanXRQr2_Chr02g0050361 [Helianthus annuus]KAJ0603684.1 hypothetical protein HanHA300_Chr02g0041041 [Helianthus annuus]KAJ0613881.1 hypothetical protein HanIR_Chr02g0056261 [Helianthus annuus]KAJ0617658.1 hypothetical protein HanHA89_Chr02g0044261 [Helianthus annuus]KAJ0776196.1 hypothetical protein HanLR1_Chr02g0042811 [Helianthus annuus]
MSHFLIEKKKRDLAIQMLAAFAFFRLFSVPSNSKYSDVELRSDEVEIYSEVKVPSFEKLGWCKITRNSDLCSATLQNKSLNVIFVDGTDVPSEDTIMIRCGSEIIPGPVSDGYLSYRFKVMPINESSKKVLQVTLEILRDRIAEAHEVCVIESGGYHTQRFF